MNSLHYTKFKWIPEKGSSHAKRNVYNHMVSHPTHSVWQWALGSLTSFHVQAGDFTFHLTSKLLPLHFLCRSSNVPGPESSDCGDCVCVWLGLCSGVAGVGFGGTGGAGLAALGAGGGTVVDGALAFWPILIPANFYSASCVLKFWRSCTSSIIDRKLLKFTSLRSLRHVQFFSDMIGRDQPRDTLY